MPRWKPLRQKPLRYSWVFILAALFVLAKQTCGIPTSWWWILTNIPLGMFLQNLTADL